MSDVIRLWIDEFDALPNYSTTVPTGVCPGKTWKRRINLRNMNLYERDVPPIWWIGQYVEMNGVLYTKFFEASLLQGPRQIGTKSRFKTSCAKGEL